MSTIWKYGQWLIWIPLLSVVAIILYRILVPIFFSFIMLGMSLMTTGMEDVKEYQYSFNIEAMKDNSVYVVSRHSTDNILKYQFTRKMDGKIVVGNTNASQSAIIETSERPHVKVYYVAPKWYPKAYIWVSKKSSINRTDDMMDKYYEYHIPHGSVINEFNVDLE